MNFGEGQHAGCIRVLHVIDKLSNDGSGVHGPARQLIYRLPCYDKQRLQAAVCTLHRDEEGMALLRQREIPTFCISRPMIDPRVVPDLLRLFADWKPHILHLHGYRSWDIGRLVGCWRHLPVVVQEHADGRVEVSALNPEMMSGVASNPALAELGAALTEKMQRVLDAL